MTNPDDAPHGNVDDDAVNNFAVAMKGKLAQARAKGRSGWQECSPISLSAMLREHVEKGDPVDVANFCMFLWDLGHPINAPLSAGTSAADKLTTAIYETAQRLGIANGDHSTISSPEALHLLECIKGQKSAGDGAELSIGVSVTEQGAAVCLMQPNADGSTTVIYSETHPTGDSIGHAVLADHQKRVPS